MSGNSSFHMTSLKLSCFNVENLTPKLDESDFFNLMKAHDICLFTETWLTSVDKIDLPLFWDYHVIRCKNPNVEEILVEFPSLPKRKLDLALR